MEELVVLEASEKEVNKNCLPNCIIPQKDGTTSGEITGRNISLIPMIRVRNRSQKKTPTGREGLPSRPVTGGAGKNKNMSTEGKFSYDWFCITAGMCDGKAG